MIYIVIQYYFYLLIIFVKKFKLMFKLKIIKKDIER